MPLRLAIGESSCITHLAALFAWTLLAALLIMLLAPDSPLGKAARETLVEAPARFMLDMTWAKAGRISLLGPLFVLLVMAGPEMFAMLVMMGGDLAAVELLLVVWGMSIAGGFASFWNRITGAARFVARLASLPQRFLARRAPRQRRRKTGARRPDREDEPAWAFA